MLLELIAVTIAPGIDLRRVGPLSGMEASSTRSDVATSLDSTWPNIEGVGRELLRTRQERRGRRGANGGQSELGVQRLREKAPEEVLTRAKRTFKQGAWLLRLFADNEGRHGRRGRIVGKQSAAPGIQTCGGAMSWTWGRPLTSSFSRPSSARLWLSWLSSPWVLLQRVEALTSGREIGTESGIKP